ncbi:MAG: hypothetical protein VYA21_05510, partial [Verrucomicrobiota bacterium]|nr:hypothetical protein [Verrucomicrobiota bacterium]
MRGKYLYYNILAIEIFTPYERFLTAIITAVVTKNPPVSSLNKSSGTSDWLSLKMNRDTITASGTT